MTGNQQPLKGLKPGDRRVRVERPHAALFRYTGHNQLTAKGAAHVPRTTVGRLVARVPPEYAVPPLVGSTAV